jgi:phosphoribosylanthranilate isomerase
MNRTRIKICGLTREQDVYDAVAAGVDALGFVIYAKSARAITAERAGVILSGPDFSGYKLNFADE